MGRFQTVIPWILPSALILAGLLGGLFTDRIILTKLRKLTGRTKWGADEMVVKAFRGMLVFWGTLIGIYAALFSLPLSPALLGLVHKILLVGAIFSITIVAARIAVGLVGIYAGRVEGVFPATSIFSNLTRLLIFVLGALVIMQSLEISVTPILTALGVGGLAVALALQPTLSNLFSGLQIIAARQVRPGDYVKLDSGDEGYVSDITWRNTAIRARPNNMIIVPNSRLASAIVTNHYQPTKEMTVTMQVGVAYDSDLEHVEQVTVEVAREVLKEVRGGVRNFEPYIRYHTFGAFSINFTVFLRAGEFTDQYLLKHEFVKRLNARYRDEGIEIPFPDRNIRFDREHEQSNI
jgi:small-conductance mechanosensitive channel